MFFGSPVDEDDLSAEFVNVKWYLKVYESVIRLVIDLILLKKTMIITKLVSLYLSLNKTNCERREKKAKVLFKHHFKPLD